MGAKEIAQYESDIRAEIKELERKMLKPNKIPDIYEKHLKSNLEYLKWMKRKYNILVAGKQYTVAQREIFYCELGVNIGSEQSERRPVVILQNNGGNRSGNTTVVAPVTTHNKSVQYDTKFKKFYIEITESKGNITNKYLDYYEVPLELESYTGNIIYGFVNVAHIREIDRKRINQASLGKITDKCMNNLRVAIMKNLR